MRRRARWGLGGSLSAEGRCRMPPTGGAFARSGGVLRTGGLRAGGGSAGGGRRAGGGEHGAGLGFLGAEGVGVAIGLWIVRFFRTGA
jgi:hypothetical protein